MSRIVKLSTGEEVHLSERYTRKAQRAYSHALGLKYVEGDDGGMDVTKEIPLDCFDLADEAALLCMIEKIVNGASEQPVSQAWIDELLTKDFSALSVALAQVRKGEDKKKS